MQHVIDRALPVLIDAVGTEPDEECCMAAITGMGAILLASGPIACQSYIERIAQAMNAVCSGETVCLLAGCSLQQNLTNYASPPEPCLLSAP